MTHASVFSGIGGPEVAAAMLGWENLFHCEINDFGRKILEYWFPESKSYEDITKTDFSEWRGKIDVLTGGFPCQPFSYAGKRRGAKDDRYLWPYMLRCIDQIRPNWVVAENVVGVTTMVEQGEISSMGGQATIFKEVDNLYRFRQQSTFTIERICYNLESHGYSVQPVLIPACSVGAPHRRDRVFIIGRRKNTLSDTKKLLVNWCELGNGSYDSRKSQSEFRGRYCQETERKSHSYASEQCGERLQFEQSEYSESEQIKFGRRSCENDDKRYASYDNSERFFKPDASAKPGKSERFNSEEDYKCGIADLRRWDSFPTISPVHRRNDGLPFDVDDLTISFSKWRTESLKAYGNAIVPQVIYEIFRAIDIVEKNIK